MEIQRTLVIIGLAVVSYMMVLAWQEDYGKPAAATVTTEQAATNIPASSDAASDVPGAEEIPTVASGEAEIVATDAVVTDDNRLVRVTTDVFNVVIDRQGGDIVELSLLNYPRHVDTPDQPFQLLLNTPQQFQIMQSGLIGKNGTDTQEGRPLWLADRTEYTLEDNAHELNVDLRYFQQDNVV
ncbi:MAG: membrane protein insertase YidC, partial [Alcanivoracaceae bacterium]|nr:membrane protein insertase YidC [Alcanivoracaceae bacterium]